MIVKKYKLVILFCVLLLGVLLSLGSFQVLPAKSSDDPEHAKQEIIVGGDFDYKPFTFLDSTGVARGFDVDMIKSIADKYNLDLEFRFTKWDEALKNLEKGKVDVLLSVIYTEQRDTVFDYTIPYNEDYYGIFVRKNSDIENVADLADKHIMSLKGDASVTRFIKPMALYSNTTLVKSLPEAIQLLSEGKCDAVLSPYSIGMETIDDLNIKNVKTTGPSILPILYRFVVKEGNSALLSLLNDGIDEMKVSGKKEEILEKWNFHRRNEVSLMKVFRYVLIGLVPILLLIIILIIWTRTLRKHVAKQTQSLNEQKAALEELNATKDKLFSVIAHDLKSPFNSILGLSELLLDDTCNYNSSNVKKLVKHIHSTAKNTFNLTENLLSWAKTQTGQMNYNPEELRLHDVLNQVVDIVNASAEVKNISVNIDKIPDVKVYADENMLKSILYNLLSNAVKFTHQNGNINISARPGEKYIEIIVSDDGVGMNEKAKNKLFKIESNFSTQGTAKETGSGLGLILCKEFVEHHGGKIWVESLEEGGTSFLFTLPLSP
jgi:signal transduction histidine kinase